MGASKILPHKCRTLALSFAPYTPVFPGWRLRHDAALSSSTQDFDLTSIDDVPCAVNWPSTATMSYLTRTLGNIRRIGLKVCLSAMRKKRTR